MLLAGQRMIVMLCMHDEVVLELLKRKCLPVLLYDTEACRMKKSHIASLQFVVNSCFAKKVQYQLENCYRRVPVLF